MTTLEMRQQRYSLVQEMHKLANSTSPADASRWKELNDKQDALRVSIEQSETTEKIQKELDQVRNAERPNIGVYGADVEHATPLERARAIRSSESYKKEFETYVRTGKTSPHLEEMRALGAATGADGATLVPQGFEQELEIKLKAYGGMTRNCRTLSTSTGNPLPWPNLDDTSNTGEWLAEGAPTTTSGADPVISNVVLGANLVSSKQVKVSVQLEQDSAFDMVGLLRDAFAIRIGRTVNYAYTVGDGESDPSPITGLITALVAAGGRSVLATGGFNNSGNDADTDLNSIGTDDLDALITNQDALYRQGAISMANVQSFDKLRTLKDKYGRPIWQTSLAVGKPDTINGYGMDWNADMATIGAGNISILFGQFSKYVVRNLLGFTFVRFNELYMTNYQRAYQAFARTDAKLLQSSAFSYLIHPDS